MVTILITIMLSFLSDTDTDTNEHSEVAETSLFSIKQGFD